MNKKLLQSSYIFAIALLLFALCFKVVFRIDLSSDKRYSISQQTKNLLRNAQQPVDIIIYLDGDLNPGFQRLKTSTRNLIAEMSVYASKQIHITFENPSKSTNETERQQRYAALEAQGIGATAIYERDKEGKAIQKIIFPWMKISSGKQSVNVNLLKNIRGNSGEENLNISIENLEYEITDGLRRVLNTKISKIAFIEGHGELNEAETYSVSKILSRYFQIDRGILSNDASVLNEYKAIIIAKPTQAFSEMDKFIIDQYIMHGGRVLWLLDGVKLAVENLSRTGLTPAIDLDINLSDQLFNYGIKIAPVLLQDIQSVQVPMNIAPADKEPQFEPTPFFFMPLLLCSYQHPITRNMVEVKASFASAIETVGENTRIQNHLLLASSDNTHIMSTPAMIELSQQPDIKDKNYFNAAYVPVAVLSEGQFTSNYRNRIIPPNLLNISDIKTESSNTKQIFVADGDIIGNETTGIASDSTTLPAGFDRYMNQQFGNQDFIRNAVLYLTDEDGWLQLRARTFQLRLLNKNIILEQRLLLQIINLLLPIVVLFAFGLLYRFYRKKIYTRK